MCECCCSSKNDAVVIRVEGIKCDESKITVEKAVNALPGVGLAQVNLKEKTITVKFDSSVIGVDAINKAILDASYEVA